PHNYSNRAARKARPGCLTKDHGHDLFHNQPAYHPRGDPERQGRAGVCGNYKADNDHCVRKNFIYCERPADYHPFSELRRQKQIPPKVPAGTSAIIKTETALSREKEPFQGCRRKRAATKSIETK